MPACIMMPFRWCAIAGLAALLVVVPAARAQKGALHIGYVYPAGGQQGATAEVTIGGQFLTGVTEVYVTGTGVQTTLVEHTKAITKREYDKLRIQLDELMQRKKAALAGSKSFKSGKGGKAANRKGKEAPSAVSPREPGTVTWTAEDEKSVVAIRKKMSLFVRRPANPAISELVTVQVAIAPDAQPGQREIRIASPTGLSNPLAFCVGQLPEFSEKASKAIAEQKSQVAKTTFAPKSRKAGDDMKITLPATVNGQILPGEVDRFRFTARAGQQLVVAAAARQLIPYLPDGVPGWFQATLALYDAKGKELAYDDDFRFSPDPVLYYRIPAFGEYVVEIKDSIYRGREDFVYRITIGELPFVTSIFPLGGPTGARTTVKVAGWNLPVAKLTPDAKDKEPGVYPVCVSKERQVSNFVPFAVDTLPEGMEQEPNNSQGSAQPVTLPIVVNGRVDQPGDADLFRFEGRAGEMIVAEVHARRLNSPLDSVVSLTDATGAPLAINDDHEDKGSGLDTHHADSYLSVRLPADGAYYLHLADAQHKGGPEYAYRLRISPPQPDFDLRVVPSSINVRAGSTVPVTIFALRKDGFAGDIAIALKDAPPGFKLGGGRVPAHEDKVQLTLTAPTAAQAQPINLHLEGRATIEGRSVVHVAVPAEDMMQAFAYRHLVPSKELSVAVAGRSSNKAITVKILGEMPVKIPAGGTATVQFASSSRSFPGKPHFQLNDAPEGIAIRNVSSSREGMEIELQSDATKVKPGLRGNLIVTASTGKPAPAGKGKAKANSPPQATLPAIPFEIVRQ